jgi:flavin-dependent dehydrogenase
VENSQVAPDYDLIVAGAGPAGSACAITAARAGARVLLLEKDRMPRHKVCGEFVSPESLHLLNQLLAGSAKEPFAGQPLIPTARIFMDGKVVALPVSPAARSIARFDLDATLLQAARHAGVRAEEAVAVRGVTHNGLFTVQAAGTSWSAKAVVNATGRWSQLTQYSITGQTRWIGLKAHYTESNPPATIDLYFFPGGYCGVSPVGKDVINAATLVRADAARSMDEVLAAHPELWRRSRDWEPLFPAIATSALYFRAAHTEDHGMIQAGDAAGFIDPFAGDGISLALHSGTLAAESLAGFFRGTCSLTESHRRYRRVYRRRFAPAFRNAARLRALLSSPAWMRSGFMRLMGTPPVARIILRGTRARTA